MQRLVLVVPAVMLLASCGSENQTSLSDSAAGVATGAAHDSPSMASARECPRPNGDPDWAGLDWSATTPDEAKRAFPRDVVIPSPAVSRLGGTYSLVVATATGEGTASPDAAREARGRMTLLPTPAEYRHAPNPRIEYPFYGFTTVRLDSLGPVSLAYSPADSAARRPGVQVRRDADSRTVELILGNASTPAGVTLHAGLTFTVLMMDSLGFRGWWMNNALERVGSEPLVGYFCAWHQDSGE